MKNQEFTSDQELLIKLFLGLSWILDKYCSETNKDKDLTISHLIIQVTLVLKKLSTEDKNEVLEDVFKTINMFNIAIDIIENQELKN